MPDVSSFGARLALVRHAKGWNVKEAALACGLAVQSWRNWEEGRRPQDLIDACRKISAATGVSYDWLLDGRDLVRQPGTGYDTTRYLSDDAACLSGVAGVPSLRLVPTINDDATEHDDSAGIRRALLVLAS